VNIRLHIERLVVNGVALEPGARGRLQAALEKELTRLLASGDGALYPALLAGGTMPRLEVGSIVLSGDGNATQLGKSVAGVIYGGLKGTGQE
jgi:hypothetical protein